MGIDPSLTSTGYAFIRIDRERLSPLSFGEIKTKSGQPLSERLAIIYRKISDLLEEYLPDEVAIEEVFYARNPKSALMLGYARGAALLAAANREIPVAEYSAREIKLAVTGYGNASKEQVRRMIKLRVTLPEGKVNYDVSDAFAVAICHLHRCEKLIKW